VARVDLRNVSVVYPVLGFGSRIRPGGRTSHTGSAMVDRADIGRGVLALDNISIGSARGDRVAVVGGNGSGKTTLLRVVAGIYEPVRGMALTEGRVMSVFNIGIGSNVEASGYRNIYIRGLMAGLTPRQIEAKIPEIAAFSELGEFLELPLRTYSQGMAVRLAFATTTAFDPDILVLDEWLGAGDAAFRAKATARMHEFVGRAGILWFASHNHELLRAICNKAIWLDGGKMRAVGAVEEVLGQYESATGQAKARQG
jgi:ABC-type polysaccharide/polyol phosphate transport system ATPase subunit